MMGRYAPSNTSISCVATTDGVAGRLVFAGFYGLTIWFVVAVFYVS